MSSQARTLEAPQLVSRSPGGQPKASLQERKKHANFTSQSLGYPGLTGPQLLRGQCGLLSAWFGPIKTRPLQKALLSSYPPPTEPTLRNPEPEEPSQRPRSGLRDGHHLVDPGLALCPENLLWRCETKAEADPRVMLWGSQVRRFREARFTPKKQNAKAPKADVL